MSKLLEIKVAERQDLIRASIDPASINADERTFDVVWSTGAEAPTYARMGEEGWLEFDEVLSLDEKEWDFERVKNGVCPLLNDHDGFFSPSAHGVHGQLGRVLSVTMTRKEARARCQFSFDPAHEGAWLNVQKGIIRGVSPRYRVSKYVEVTKPKQTRRRFRTAMAELREISLTPIPQDAGGRVRSADREHTYAVELELAGGESDMTAKSTKNGKQDTNVDPAQDPAQDPAAGGDSARSEAAGGSPQPASSSGSPAAPAPAVQRDQVRSEQETRDQVRAAERARVNGIQEAARSLRLAQTADDKEGVELVRTLVEGDTSLENARAALIFERARRDQLSIGPSIVQVGNGPRDAVRSGVENAIEHRIGARNEKGEPVQLTQAGRDFRGMSLLRMAEECVRSAGGRVTGLTKDEIARAAFGQHPDGIRSGGMHSTSDFAEILSNVANKTLREAYAARPAEWKKFSRRVTASDFKPLTRLQLGDAPHLEKIDEHGQFKRGTVAESKETLQVEDYGKIFAITRRAIINDDTSAFDRLPRMFGAQAAELEHSKAIGLLLANPTMSDGNQLISSAHANTTTGALGETALQAQLLALTKQKGLDARTLIGNRPKYLLVPAALEVAARKLVTTITPAQSSNVNVFQGMLEVIVEPRLDIGVDGQTGDAVKFWMIGDPMLVDFLEHAYLDGQEGVYLEQRLGFEVDGVELKARHTFGVAAIEWRGVVRSTGT